MALRFKGVPNLPFAPIAAAIFGLGAAAFVFAIPVYYVERAAEVSGLASVLPAARAPLGNTAQGLIALAMAVGTFAVMWIILRPVEKLFARRKAERKARSFSFGRKQPGSMPDPDDLPLTAAETLSVRKPIFAEAELGAPLMSDAALASGGELWAAEPEKAPVVSSPSLFEEVRPLDLTSMMEELPAEVEAVAKPEPEETITPAPVAPPVEWLTPEQDASAVEPAPMAEPDPIDDTPDSMPVVPSIAEEKAEEPTLRELLVRFETALKKRREAEAASQSPVSPFPDTAVSSLRDLMAVNRMR